MNDSVEIAENTTDIVECPDTDIPLLVIENVSEINREIYYDAVKTRGNSVKLWIFTALGILLIPLGLLMYQYWVWILGIVIAFLAQFSNIIIGRRDYIKLKKIHPEGTWTKTVRFYEDYIETDSGANRVTTYAYSEVTKTKEGKRTFVIS